MDASSFMNARAEPVLNLCVSLLLGINSKFGHQQPPTHQKLWVSCETP